MSKVDDVEEVVVDTQDGDESKSTDYFVCTDVIQSSFFSSDELLDRMNIFIRE